MLGCLAAAVLLALALAALIKYLFFKIVTWWRTMDLRQSDWLGAFRAYFAVIAIGNLAWEGLQLPLYTIWTIGTVGEQAFAVIHCTGSDLLIALASLMAALLLIGTRDWPALGFGRVALVAIVLGVTYTGFSEWLNVSVRRSWAYSDWMPVMPIGTARIGLSPLIQWIIVPATAFWAAARSNVTTSR